MVQKQSLTTSRPILSNWSSSKGNFRTLSQSSPLSMTLYVMEYLFVHFRSGVLAESPPNILPMPYLLAGGIERETEMALVFFKHGSAMTKMLVSYNTVLVTNIKLRHHTTQIMGYFQPG